jgi:Domain of unknown function (DUF4403)
LPAAAPEVAAASALPSIESRVTVQVALDTRRLARELERRVPVVLAHARARGVGAAGVASYVVRRGGFALSLAGNRLVVETPVSVELAVCKPLGPFCPTYGRCSPRLASRVSVPLELGPSYAVGLSRVSVAVTRPCVLEPVGLDVTPLLEREARRQAGDLERRIDRELPELKPELSGAWGLFHVPVALGTSLCMRVAPERVDEARPKLDGHTLSGELAVFGQVSVEEPCPKSDPPSGSLPAPHLVDALPDGVDLEVPIRVDWTEVSANLTRSLAGDAVGSVRVTKVEARASRPGVLIDLTLDGATCGDVWLEGEPYYDAASSAIRLRHVRYADGQAARARALGADALPGEIERRARVGLPVDVASAPGALEALLEQLTRDKPAGVRVSLKLKPARVARVLVDERSLVPVASLDGSASVEVEQ